MPHHALADPIDLSAPALAADKMATPHFVWPIRVYYEDTDCGGIVYYANFLKFFERCRTEWLRDLGIDQQKMAVDLQRQFVVTAVEMSYRRPARLDDLLQIEASIAALTPATLTFAQAARRGDELLATAQVKVACVDTVKLSPVRLPALLNERLRAWATAGMPDPSP